MRAALVPIKTPRSGGFPALGGNYQREGIDEEQQSGVVLAMGRETTDGWKFGNKKPGIAGLHIAADANTRLGTAERAVSLWAEFSSSVTGMRK